MHDKMINATVIHFVNNYSGALRYSVELMSCCENDLSLHHIFVYTNCSQISELEIEQYNNYTIINFPKFKFKYFNVQNNLTSHIVKVVSMYIAINEKIIIHDNGVLFTNDNIENGFGNSKYKLIHSLHFFAGKVDNLSYFDSIICVTKFAFDNIGEKVKILIYNGVREVVATKSRDSVRSRYGFGAAECLVLYVGRIEQSKGITFLAKLFSGMGLENVRLVIVGDGAYDLVFDKIESNHSRITFLGKLDNKEIHNLMVACDIGVIPSLNEQCSYVALEMMSHGMAIIASEVRGMGELFVGRDIALTVPVDYNEDDVPILNEEVLRQHIITLADDAELRKQLGANARKEWAEKYTAERMTRETMEVYRELAAQF